MDGLWEKRGGAVYPVSEDAWQFLRGLPNHARFIAVTYDPNSNSEQQRKFFFALIETLFHNQDKYTSKTKFRNYLMVHLGFCSEGVNKSGEKVAIAESVARNAMKLDRMRDLIDAVLDFAEEMGFDRAELLAQTREMAGAA